MTANASPSSSPPTDWRTLTFPQFRPSFPQGAARPRLSATPPEPQAAAFHRNAEPEYSGAAQQSHTDKSQEDELTAHLSDMRKKSASTPSKPKKWNPRAHKRPERKLRKSIIKKLI